jgi:nicotinamidase-related amidase
VQEKEWWPIAGALERDPDAVDLDLILYFVPLHSETARTDSTTILSPAKFRREACKTFGRAAPDGAPTEGELVVPKRAVSGFAGTELDRLLRVHDISTVVIAGIITNFAAERTARDASDRGYRVVVLGDCCESIDDEMHAFAITKILPIVGTVIGAEDFARTLASPHRP